MQTASEIVMAGDAEQKEWLIKASAREIQAYIHLTGAMPHQTMYQYARTALEVRLGEDFLESSERMERMTKWLVRLTWVLVAFTLVLLVFTAFSIK